MHIPKGKGQTRPLGISCFEDKIVQGALREVLEAVYEPLFVEDSYGFRPRLRRKLNGHYNYFGANGNSRSLGKLYNEVKRTWRKWLNRRSQRGRMPWKRFTELLKKHPLPQPRISVQIGSRTP